MDRDELRQLVARLGKRLTDQQLSEAMDEMDEDGSGEVDYEEFEEWWKETAQKKGSALGGVLGKAGAGGEERERGGGGGGGPGGGGGGGEGGGCGCLRKRGHGREETPGCASG